VQFVCHLSERYSCACLQVKLIAFQLPEVLPGKINRINETQDKKEDHHAYQELNQGEAMSAHHVTSF
jgi:hypothetical protein